MANTPEHLDVLNKEQFSSQQLRIIHNTSINLMFVNCTATATCKDEFRHLITTSERGIICSGCEKTYGDTSHRPVLQVEYLKHGWEDRKFAVWAAAWLGVEPRHVHVAVSP